MEEIREIKARAAGKEPDYVVMPKEGAIVSKDYYKHNSYAAGYRIPYPKDYEQLFKNLVKKLPKKKNAVVDFNAYFTPISMKDYTDPQFYTGVSISKAPLPPEKIAPERSMIDNDEEVYSDVKLLESNWLGLKVAQASDPLKFRKVIFISNGGFAIISNNVDAYNKGIVPEECYLIDAVQNPYGFEFLDEKYFIGDHEDFLMEYYNVALNKLHALKDVIASTSPDFTYIVDDDILKVEMALSDKRLSAQKHLQ